VRAFRQWFMNYGLVASILVSTALVAVLAYRLEGSRWRWPMVLLALAGLGTVAGIFWIRRYIDRQPKAPDEGSLSSQPNKPDKPNRPNEQES
jgi:hypothetical protein